MDGSGLAPSIDQADTVRRCACALEAPAGSLDRLLGFVVADPEMSGNTVHHDLLRRVGASLPLGS
jgi:hypothetical protein